MSIEEEEARLGSRAVAVGRTLPIGWPRAVRGALGLSVLAILVAALPAAAQPAPAALDFSLSPTQIDASVGGATVIIGFTLDAATLCLESCEDLASPTQVRLVQRDSGQVLDATFLPVAGSTPGRFEATLAFPASSAGGVWEVEQLLIAEADGRRAAYGKADLDGVGASTEVLNTSTAGDEVPPELLALGAAPPAVDTSTGEQSVTATAVFSETQSLPCLDACADSGSPSLLRFAHAASGQVRDARFEAIGGDQLTAAARFQTPSAPGTWEVVGIELADAAGSRQHYDAARLVASGLDASFDNQSPSGDEAAPEVDSAATEPEVIDTSAGAVTVTVTATLRDAGSGVCVSDSSCDDGGSATEVRFVNPVSGQTRQLSLARVSGTSLDGVYQGQILLPQSSEGEFDRVTLLAADVQGNRRVVRVPEPASGALVALLTIGLCRALRRRSSA